MRLFDLIVALSLIGCASHRVPDHTLLYTPDRRHNIWSYEPIDGEGFISRPLEPGQRVVLKGGAVISSDGDGLVVNGTRVNELNAVVDSNGDVHEGAFIRTFD